MKLKLYKLIKSSILFMILILIICACSFGVSGNLSENKENSSGTENEPKEVTITGYLDENLKGAVPEEILSRSALPSVNLTSYYYVVKANNGTVATVDKTTSTYSINLLSGKSYTITASAYEDSAHSKCLLTGSTTITVSDGTVTSGSSTIKMALVSTDGNSGTVNLPVKITADSGITSAKVTWSLSGVEKSQSLDLDSSSDKLETAFTMIDDTDGGTTIASGLYTVKFTFYKGTVVAYSFTESLTVCDNLTTDKWVNSVGAVYITDSNVLITKALADSYLLKDFYVDSTNGDDTNNNGDFFTPVATVQQAVNLIDAVNDGISSYSIIIMGEVDASASSFTTISNIGGSYISIEPSASLNLTIKSNSSSSRVINAGGWGTGRVIYIGSKANVTLNNLCIIDGEFKDLVTTDGVYSSCGAGILVLGNSTEPAKCTIENCKITGNGNGNAKTFKGGGIYVSNGSVSISDSTLTENGASYGAGIYCNSAVSNNCFMTNVKMSQNTASTSGNDIYINTGAGLQIDNSSIKTTTDYSVYNCGSLYISGKTVIYNTYLDTGAYIYPCDYYYDLSGNKISNTENVLSAYADNNNLVTTIAVTASFPLSLYDSTDSSTYVEVLKERVADSTFVSEHYKKFTSNVDKHTVNSAGRIIYNDKTTYNVNVDTTMPVFNSSDVEITHSITDNILTASVSDSTYASYTWIFNGESQSAATSTVTIDVSTLAAGSYELLVIAQKADGQIDTGTAYVQITQTLKAGN